MSVTIRTSNSVSPLFFLLFGIPFGGVGLLLFLLGISQLSVYYDSAQWVKTPAQFEQIEVKSRRGSKGGTFHYLSVTYTYDVLGKSYQGHDLFFEDVSNRDPQPIEANANRIKAGLERDHSFPVLVNPKNPEQAVVFREFLPEMIMLPMVGGIFGAAGLGVMLFGLYSFLHERKKNKALEANPQRPWKAEEQWKGFTVISHSYGQLLVTWGIALFMNLFISIFVVALATDPTAPLIAKMVIGLFGLVAVGLLCYAVYLTLQYLKYGNSSLQLSQMPLVTGQDFSAVIIVGRHLEMPKGCTVTFKCRRALTTGSGKHAHTTTTELHTDTQIIQQDLFRPEKGRSAIPVSFKIPPHLPPRDVESNPKFTWVLEVAAETPGIDFTTEFDLPVYHVADLSLVERRDGGF
ncbi:MAG TPA: DUF3592 domain-containing protein [Candidatus Ozemobacteraceae bacterium]|nr:DUF3592 domain-containing protein [Candidatus Ozemobacteraceae bacterium]